MVKLTLTGLTLLSSRVEFSVLGIKKDADPRHVLVDVVLRKKKKTVAQSRSLVVTLRIHCKVAESKLPRTTG